MLTTADLDPFEPETHVPADVRHQRLIREYGFNLSSLANSLVDLLMLLSFDRRRSQTSVPHPMKHLRLNSNVRPSSTHPSEVAESDTSKQSTCIYSSAVTSIKPGSHLQFPTVVPRESAGQQYQRQLADDFGRT